MTFNAMFEDLKKKERAESGTARKSQAAKTARTASVAKAAHTGTDGAMSQKASDYSCVPPCADCHTQAPGAYHRTSKGTFERRHGLCFARIVAELNHEWQARCA
jgi:hypothetical protein